ncbi:Uncharacterised protein [Mycobacterium tuberculosis]|nr:Uncharacterised protein [Mycobacterium tuberculosis]SGE68778.1 Uncharacterised protein [Mycobacterium tuberculosis]SHA74274.1 Uncharacterised protein [Mycobacterium tuberculosis]
MGTGLGRPSLVKVVSSRYCASARSEKVGVTGANLPREQTQNRMRGTPRSAILRLLAR